MYSLKFTGNAPKYDGVSAIYNVTINIFCFIEERVVVFFLFWPNPEGTKLHNSSWFVNYQSVFICSPMSDWIFASVTGIAWAEQQNIIDSGNNYLLKAAQNFGSSLNSNGVLFPFQLIKYWT